MTSTPDKPAGEALKACPFCGREQAIISPYLDTDQTAWACVCRVCGARMDAMSKARAAAAWNTRTPPPSALDDDLEKQCGSLVERLRTMGNGLPQYGYDWFKSHLLEAADRIERLEAPTTPSETRI